MTTKTIQERYRQEACAHFLMMALDPTDDDGIRREGHLDAELMGSAVYLGACYCSAQERVQVPSQQTYIQWAQEFLVPDGEWGQILQQHQHLRKVKSQARTAAQQDHESDHVSVSEEDLCEWARQHTAGLDEVDASTFVAYYAMARRYLQSQRENR